MVVFVRALVCVREVRSDNARSHNPDPRNPSLQGEQREHPAHD